MKKWHFLFLVLFLPFAGCEREGPVEPAEPVGLLAQLQAIPGATVTEVPPLYGFPRAFIIDLIQPLDHGNPAGPTFSQRLYLSHVDESMPMVFAPSGYGASQANVQELAAILGTNHLSVAHRFFVEAEPIPFDWTYLNIRQAADDHHRIVTFFKEIYTGPWVSSGASKGGMTCLFHRRFYPDDVDATVAYVAPLEFGAPDLRFPAFLNTIGTEECRQRTKDFQRRCLMSRDSLLARMPAWFASKGVSASRNLEMIFEEQVASYDWTFWQYHTKDCSEIPGQEAGFDEMLQHLAEATQMDRTSDDGFHYFRPYYYQSHTELGFPARNHDHLMDLLKFTPDTLDREFIESLGFTVTYDSRTCTDVNAWLQSQGNNIILIYGSIDPWTGGAIELTGATNALKIVQPGGDHRIKIAGLEHPGIVLTALEGWLGIDIDAARRKHSIAIPERAAGWEEGGLKTAD